MGRFLNFIKRFFMAQCSICGVHIDSNAYNPICGHCLPKDGRPPAPPPEPPKIDALSLFEKELIKDLCEKTDRLYGLTPKNSITGNGYSDPAIVIKKEGNGIVKNLSEKEKQFIVGLEKLTRETGFKIIVGSYDDDLSLGKAEITSDESGYGYEYGYLEWLDPGCSDQVSPKEYFDENKHTIVK